MSAMDWRPFQGVSCLLSSDFWDRLQHPLQPRRISGIVSHWINAMEELLKKTFICKLYKPLHTVKFSLSTLIPGQKLLRHLYC